MSTSTDIPSINPPEGRVDGVAKVTGKGKYSAEYKLPGLLYGVMVGCKIASGKINAIDVSAARNAPGVVDVLTHLNRPAAPGFADPKKALEERMGLPVFHTDTIYFFDQPIAIVIADTFEQAIHAASLVKASYSKTPFKVDIVKAYDAVNIKEDEERGDFASWQNVPAKITAEYLQAIEVHNAMEMFSTIAHWTDDTHLTLYEKTQGVRTVQNSFAKVFALPMENIKVIAEFVGGGFGSGLRVWPHAYAAALAAKKTKRPVKVMLTRPQMFTSVGYRPYAWQKIIMGADSDGTFRGLLHHAKNNTSVYENFTENITGMSKLMYDFPNLKTGSANFPINIGTPVWMRAPGEATGAFALESAIDELSYKLNMDPVQLRLKNIPKEDPEKKVPWSSNFYKECLERGAAKFNWNQRPQAPASLTDGEWHKGYGTAGGTWKAGRGKASINSILMPDGSLTISSSVTDIGTGTGTALLNIAAERTGIAKNKIRVLIGNSDYPDAPSQGGSRALATVGGALADAMDAMKEKLAELASSNNKDFAGKKAADLIFDGDRFKLASGGSVSIKNIFERNNLKQLVLDSTSNSGNEQKEYSINSFAAHFCEVLVHRLTQKIRVTRFLSVVDAGKVVSPRPAANQVIGAVVGGIGAALMEEEYIDLNQGKIVANDLAGYHFAVNADVPVVDVEFINIPDPYINAMGAKGLGEVGMIGVTAAVANAVYNATGKRIRALPITPDKMLG